MNRFFVSDYHMYHDNILKFCNRPFANARDMNESFFENHNKVVRPGDEVYFLGDLGFGHGDRTKITEHIASRLHGQIHWVFGNHDKHETKKANGFAWKGNDKIIKIGVHKIHLYHYCIRQWDCKHYGSIHLYGHDHTADSDVPDERSLNVCVDCNNYRLGEYRPIEFEEVLVELRKKQCSFPDFSYGKIADL